jgi:regulatory protein
MLDRFARLCEIASPTGAERAVADALLGELRELGVAAEHVQAALAEGGHDELEAAVALLARRFPAPPETPRERDRALAVLLRKGYELELAHDALRRFAGATVD